MSFTGFPRLALFALVGLAVAEPAVAQEKMYNRGRHDVWVAFGQHRTGGEEGLYTKFWTELKAGTFIEIPKEYSGYVRVVAVVNGKHHLVRPTRLQPTHLFPIHSTETESGTAAVRTGDFGNEAAVTRAIEAQGLRAVPFYPLSAFRYRDGAPVGVLATEAAQQDLDKATNTRSLAVLAGERHGRPGLVQVPLGNRGQWNLATVEPGKAHLWTEVQPGPPGGRVSTTGGQRSERSPSARDPLTRGGHEAPSDAAQQVHFHRQPPVARGEEQPAAAAGSPRRSFD